MPPPTTLSNSSMPTARANGCAWTTWPNGCPLPAREAAPEGMIEIPASLGGATRRGKGDVILAFLRVLKLDPTEKIAQEAVDLAIRHFEDKVDPPPGLYHVSPTGVIDHTPIEPGDLPATNDPYLVLIHGTFSSAGASFGRLFEKTDWRALAGRYGDRVLALQHRTLSESPAENALFLAQRLPKGAHLHMITHSRGGLVGELLARGPASKEDLEPFAQKARPLRDSGSKRDQERLRAIEKTMAALKDLGLELRAKGFQVDRFVRVACPAYGTTLASHRLDTFLSVFLNLIDKIPQVDDLLVYPFAKATILSIIQQRAEPDQLPGLEAMMPESLFIDFLNKPSVISEADLAVIAGDIEGEGIWQTIKVGVTDLFYWSDHDLVVNTRSMVAGVRRTGHPHAAVHKGPEVSHFRYFENYASRRQLIGWLSKGPGERVEGFRELPPPRVGVDAIQIPRSRGDQPAAAVVFVLPDFMATHLKVQDQRVWLDTVALSQGKLKDLALTPGKDAVSVDTVFAPGYQALVDHLGKRFDVRPFAYDWRKSVLVEGARLAQVIEEELSRHARPVHIVAHGMGGLVARAVLVEARAVWDALSSRQGRLVMVGTPQRGAYSALALLAGQGPVARMMTMLDPSHDAVALSAIFRTWPSLFEMLPADDTKVWQPKTWKDAGVVIGPKRETDAFARRLAAANEVRKQLDNAVDREHMFCIVGHADETAGGVRVEGGHLR